MKHGHTRECSKTASEESINSTDPEHLILKQFSFDVHLVSYALVLCFWRQIDVFLDAQELTCHYLLHKALDNVKFWLELSHLTFNYIQGISAKVGVRWDLIWVQVLNLEFATRLARAWIDTALLVGILVIGFIHRIFKIVIVLLLPSCTVGPIIFKLPSAQIICAVQVVIVVVVPAKLIIAILIHLLHWLLSIWIYIGQLSILDVFTSLPTMHRLASAVFTHCVVKWKSDQIFLND